MQEQYRPEDIEPKVQRHWDEKETFKVTEDNKRNGNWPERNYWSTMSSINKL